MHIDYTIHFWTVLTQISALGAGVKFLIYMARQVSELVTAMKTIITEHHEMYGWYRTMKTQVGD